MFTSHPLVLKFNLNLNKLAARSFLPRASLGVAGSCDGLAAAIALGC